MSHDAIAERLREWHKAYQSETGPEDKLMMAFLRDCAKAADLIDALFARLGRLEEELGKLVRVRDRVVALEEASANLVKAVATEVVAHGAGFTIGYINAEEKLRAVLAEKSGGKEP